MSKVLVEEPRSGRAMARSVTGVRPRFREQLDPDGESAPWRIGIGRETHQTKHFGEHLAPMYRYLRKQVGRPWSSVYSEMCRVLDRRSVIQAHLFEHIEDRVARRTVIIDGKVHDVGYGRPLLLEDVRAELFVDPVTGILMLNPHAGCWRRRRRTERAARLDAMRAERRIEPQLLGPDRQWHRIDGIWYEIRLGSLDPKQPRQAVYDLVLRRTVGWTNREVLRSRYGRGDRYAVGKRQLDSATLKRHRLPMPPPS